MSFCFKVKAHQNKKKLLSATFSKVYIVSWKFWEYSWHAFHLKIMKQTFSGSYENFHPISSRLLKALCMIWSRLTLGKNTRSANVFCAVRDTVETIIAQLHVEPHSTSLRLTINWKQLQFTRGIYSRCNNVARLVHQKSSNRVLNLLRFINPKLEFDVIAWYQVDTEEFTQ